MNDDRRINLWVGIFALACIAVFAGAVLSLSAQRGFWVQQVRLIAYFNDVQGLIEGAPVRLAGKDVGVVDGVNFSEFGVDEAPIRVDLSVDPASLRRIRDDSVASIATIGLLGDKYIEISLGTADGAALGEGSVLNSRTPLAIADVVAKGTVALDEVAELASSVNGMVRDLSTSMSATHIGETVAAVAEFAREVREGNGFFHSLIYDEYQGEGVESINRSLSTLENILTEVRHGDGVLHTLIYSTPEDEEALRDIIEATQRLNSVMTKIDEGEGTLGLLVTDPTLYEDIKRLVDGAQRSMVIRSLIKLSDDGESAAP